MTHVLQVMTKAAEMHGCTLEVTWRDPPYIPTVNNLEMVSFVEEAAKGLVGEDRWQRLAVPTMAAEDFGFMARASLSLLSSITNRSIPSASSDRMWLSCCGTRTRWHGTRTPESQAVFPMVQDRPRLLLPW